MDGKVLRGCKLEVYVLLKVLKYCTGSSATSYQCKFAVQQVFMNKNIETFEELGSAIKEIIHHKTIRGKFSSVHPDLAAEGITRARRGSTSSEAVQQVNINSCFFFIRQFSGKEGGVT